LPEEIGAKLPEGYAFYALYPEAYAAAAQRLPTGDHRVIGIRSIGSSLAAVAATALSDAAPVTVRPVGHPFQRELALGDELRNELAGHTGAFVVVDEGPGLSGSSFGAVADALEELGVEPGRIAFLPGHGGELGPQASERHKSRWARALRPVAGFDEVVRPHLVRWCEELVGPAVEPLQDISGGAWRERVYGSEAEWPPANAAQERLKFLLGAESGTWLLKFGGLGRIGERKLERARALHAAGFTPEVAGFRHGFLVERWREDAGALHDGLDRPALLERVGDYLGFRARAFSGGSGASVEALFEMAQVNAGEALGAHAADALERFRPELGRLDALVRRGETDNRMHAWEWRVAPEGLLKTDALDHHAAHDLIGAQDVGWDVVGAAVELGFDPDETARLARRVGAAPELLKFLLPSYLAFQTGAYAMAADSHAGWAAEAERLRARSQFYARRLAEALEVDPPGGRV
jgi:hypothetical protein